MSSLKEKIYWRTPYFVKSYLASLHARSLDRRRFGPEYENALKEIDIVLEEAGVAYTVFKGAANRLLLHDNPAIRACYDIDLLVCPEERVKAAAALVAAGFGAATMRVNLQPPARF